MANTIRHASQLWRFTLDPGTREARRNATIEASLWRAPWDKASLKRQKALKVRNRAWLVEICVFGKIVALEQRSSPRRMYAPAKQYSLHLSSLFIESKLPIPANVRDSCKNRIAPGPDEDSLSSHGSSLSISTIRRVDTIEYTEKASFLTSIALNYSI